MILVILRTTVALKGFIWSISHNDFSCTNFPELPLDSAETRFDNSVSTALTQKQQSSLDALSLTKEVSLDIQEKQWHKVQTVFGTCCTERELQQVSLVLLQDGYETLKP